MNWKKLISDLRASGLRYSQIGREVNRTGASIASLERLGVEPSWETGQMLIALHKKVMRRKHPHIDTAA